MKADFTDITMVIDRSGSMANVREEAESGINAFIKEQAEQPGTALLTVVQFDTEYEFVCRGKPIEQVSKLSIEPRGMTALLDAVGRAIEESGTRLALMPESDRPGLVVVVIMTDGLENASRRYTKDRIREMIEHQQAKYNWQFTFLGANQDAFSEANAMGISPVGVANYAEGREDAVYRATSAKVARMRNQVIFGAVPENNFTPEELEDME